MLNTNQSNPRKSWKYAIILPVLSAFILFFQVETVAQVKAETSYAVSENFSSTVTKNTTDKELKELEKTFSNENRKLIISDVKRNKKGEINEIKLLFDTGKTYHRVLHRKSDESINDIQIFVKTDDKGNEKCEFIETNEELAAFMENEEAFSAEFESSSYTFSDKDSNSYRESINKKVIDENKKATIYFNDKEISKIEALKIKGNLIEEIIEISPNSSSNDKYGEKGKNGVVLINSKISQKKSEGISVSWNDAVKNSEKNTKNENLVKNLILEDDEFVLLSIKFDENDDLNARKVTTRDYILTYPKALFLFNEKEISKNEALKISPTKIEEIIHISPKSDEINSYGEKGKNGVIKINSEKTLSNKKQSGYGLSYETEIYSSENNISDIKEDKSTDYKKALILIDNKKINYKDLDKINPNSISQVSVFKGTDKIIEKYGEEAKNGVILIDLNTTIIAEKLSNERADFKLENNNSGFIISKNSKTDDLIFYKNTLEKNNIQFTYKNIERNKNNEIISITLNLERGKENIELKVKSDEPIQKYFIGLENNKIMIKKQK